MRGTGIMAEKPPQERAAPRRRRKEARPDEIIDAALALFAERGFGATRLEDVARRAGVAKGTLFVYFAGKDELFRAVARRVLATHLDRLQHASADLDRPLAELLPGLLAQAARIGQGALPGMARLLIAEARTFPDLARVWHEEVAGKVLGLLTAAIARAQARGEVRPGDPALHAFSILGPMMAATLYREVFNDARGTLPDLDALAAQHAGSVLHGILARPG
jgi:AcrR family transcriptional regulator